MSQPQVRAALRKAIDGMTAAEIARAIGKKPSCVNAALRVMPDVYIDRWQPAKAGPNPHTAVWVAVEVPANTPRPER